MTHAIQVVLLDIPRGKKEDPRDLLRRQRRHGGALGLGPGQDALARCLMPDALPGAGVADNRIARGTGFCVVGVVLCYSADPH